MNDPEGILDDEDVNSLLGDLLNDLGSGESLFNDAETPVTNDVTLPSNDVDVPSNDVDIPSNDVDVSSNDVDVITEPPFTVSDPCALLLENVDGNLKVGTKLFGAPPTSNAVNICGFEHLVSYIATGSFIIDIDVDYKNRPGIVKDRNVFTELSPGSVLTLEESKSNIRFNGNKPGDRAFIIFDVKALPVTEEEIPTTPTEECPVESGCLTSIDDVRRFVLDRMIDDNEIDLELFFSDLEIITARRLAVAYYNEFPPYVDRLELSECNQDCLPAPLMFLNGIAYQLYMAKLQKLHKEDVDYQAGGMTVNIVKKRIAYITSNLKVFKTEFENLASSRKTHINYMSAFGQVG